MAKNPDPDEFNIVLNAQTYTISIPAFDMDRHVNISGEWYQLEKAKPLYPTVGLLYSFVKHKWAQDSYTITDEDKNLLFEGGWSVS